VVCGYQLFTRCDAPVRLELPGGSVVWLKAQETTGPCYAGQSASGYQGQDVMSLPALGVGWQRDDSGPGVERFNNQDNIQRMLTQYNAPVIALAHGDGCGCALGGRQRGNALWVLAGLALLAWRRRSRR
jgi:MYXO-CTERM domain-containing protein